MALKAVIDSLEGVPEAIAGEYTQRDDGKFQLSVESSGGMSLEDVGGLKSALGAERGAREKAEKAARAFEGLDPSDIKAKLERLQEFEAIDPEKEAGRLADEKAAAKIEQMSQKYQQEIAAAQESIQSLEGQLDQVTRHDQATAIIVKHGGNPKLLLPHVLAQTRSKQIDGGRRMIEVLDDAGNPKIKDAQGTPMGLEDLVVEMKASDDFAPCFRGSGASGSGTPPANGAGGTGTRSTTSKRFQAMTEDEKAEARSALVVKHKGDKKAAVKEWQDKVAADLAAAKEP